MLLKILSSQISILRLFWANLDVLTHSEALSSKHGLPCPFVCKNCLVLITHFILTFLRLQILNLKFFLTNFDVLIHFGALSPQNGPLCSFPCNKTLFSIKTFVPEVFKVVDFDSEVIFGQTWMFWLILGHFYPKIGRRATLCFWKGLKISTSYQKIMALTSKVTSKIKFEQMLQDVIKPEIFDFWYLRKFWPVAQRTTLLNSSCYCLPAVKISAS